MESVIAAAITGVLTLVGVLYSNSKSKAVLELKIDQLSERVQKHNEVIARIYEVERRISVAENDIETIYKRMGRNERVLDE